MRRSHARVSLCMLLSEESVALERRRRQVMAWNTAIYRFAKSDRDAQAVYRQLGIDVFEAVLLEDRLSDRFRQEGYHRWKNDLETRRQRARRARERRGRKSSR